MNLTAEQVVNIENDDLGKVTLRMRDSDGKIELFIVEIKDISDRIAELRLEGYDFLELGRVVIK